MPGRGGRFHRREPGQICSVPEAEDLRTSTGTGRLDPSPRAPTREPLDLPRTRTSSAWVAAAFGVVLVLLMLVFILQNGERVPMEFLWFDLRVPLGAGLLLAAVLGALVVVLLGVGRMFQLRLAARRHRRAHRP